MIDDTQMQTTGPLPPVTEDAAALKHDTLKVLHIELGKLLAAIEAGVEWPVVELKKLLESAASHL